MGAQMSRQRIALLFVIYFIVSVVIPVVIVALAMPSEVIDIAHDSSELYRPPQYG